MERIDQNNLKAIYVNETTVYDNSLSIIQGTTIHFVEKSSIPALIEALKKYEKE